jgi:hypothetical protein
LYRCDRCGRIVLSTVESFDVEPVVEADGWIVGRVDLDDLFAGSSS